MHDSVISKGLKCENDHYEYFAAASIHVDAQSCVPLLIMRAASVSVAE